jgi:hypothetical protein
MTSKLSVLSAQQIPSWIREEYPTFVAFVEAYYEFMDQNSMLHTLHSAKDIDNTMDLFIDSFKRDFMTNIPDMKNLNTREFLRNAKAFYTSKGSEASFKFLFRAMYGKEISIFYPETVMLRPSDGRWSQEVSCVVRLVSGDPFSIVGQRISVNSSTTNIIRLAKRVKFLRDDYYEIFFENTGFLRVEPNYTITGDNFTSIVGYVIDKVIITKPGVGFRVGQIFEINTASGYGAKIRVTRVDENGGILFAKPVAFGAGYSGATYYGRIIPKFTDSVVNTFNNPFDKTLGTSDSGVLFDYDYSSEYSSGYEGVIYSSFFSESLSPVSASYIDADTANIEIRFGGLAKYPGFYITNHGFLSDGIKLQDNYYYQIYSYVLKLDEQIHTYRSLVKGLLHPAGMEMFAEYELTTIGDMEASMTILDKIVALGFVDVASITDTNIVDFLKGIIDTFTTNDSKYIDMMKVISDNISAVDSGSLSLVVPGDYDNYPTESYFEPNSFYTNGTTTELATW